MKGRIHWGINNIFSVYCEGSFYECRLKGKVLKETDDAYNPLSPGDEVEWEKDPHHLNKGMISFRLERRNSYSRWNKKRNRTQTLACNLDHLVLVTAPAAPPFRPRFLDRALLMAQKENLAALILVNKCDQPITQGQADRLDVYKKLGWDVLFCSVTTGEGLEPLRQRLENTLCALIGQSGVGKSSLFNTLFPKRQQKIGDLCAKYNRGKHTTNFSFLQPWSSGQGGLIDTPGVRHFEVFGIESSQLAFLYPDFKPFLGCCGFSVCTHIQEPSCAVLAAVKAQEIHLDRWETYKKLFQELRENEKTWT